MLLDVFLVGAAYLIKPCVRALVQCHKVLLKKEQAPGLQLRRIVGGGCI